MIQAFEIWGVGDMDILMIFSGFVELSFPPVPGCCGPGSFRPGSFRAILGVVFLWGGG